MKTPLELLEYAKKMRERGDSFRSIYAYLDNNCDDEKTIKNIISDLNKLEEAGEIKTPEQASNPKISVPSILIGSALAFVGVWLVILLWNSGWISTLPFILIFIGISVIFGKNPNRFFN